MPPRSDRLPRPRRWDGVSTAAASARPGAVVAELCFNTAMTGYQEIMTDPSYAGQVVTFTFPHIGNTGVTPEDDETADPVAAGMIVRWDPTEPSNWRAARDPLGLARGARAHRDGAGSTPAR